MNLTKKITPKRYLWIFIISALLFTLFITIVSFKSLFFDQLFGFQSLYKHQLDKLSSQDEIETVFVGDSSLGNLINAELFSSLSSNKTINLALTGFYGYAGSYNMLKRAIANKKNRIKNVVLLQSIDAMKRPISFEGYILTLSSLDDFMELKPNEMINMIKAFYTLTLSPGNLTSIIKHYLGLSLYKYPIENDYIKQESKMLTNQDPAPITMSSEMGKTAFLLRIIRFCNANNINLIYAHGPIWRQIGEKSSDYINTINEILSTTGVKLIKEVVFIDNKDIGDSGDHVIPNKKSSFTEKYFRLLKPLLTEI